MFYKNIIRLPLLVFALQFGLQAGASAQTNLDSNEIVQSLQGLDRTVAINAPALYQRALSRIKSSPGQTAMGRTPIADELNNLPQFTVQVQFNLNSDVIRPESYVTLGRIADSLYHPYLLEYKFLVVGNADASGKREHNLVLSQKRANAIRDALITTFGIPPSRLVALGLGEEQLQDAEHPTAPVNRRVQLFAIGKL